VPNKGASLISFESEAPASGSLDVRVLLVPDGAQVEKIMPDFLEPRK
jgi:hypothetical protein